MRFDRMDRVALGGMFALATAIVFLVVRGDQVGVQITRVSPAPNTINVPTRGLLAFTFSEPMNAKSLDGKLRLSPEVSGTVRWNGATAFFIATRPLLADTAYTLTIDAGATSARGRRLLRDEVVAFRTGHPRVIFLAPYSGVSNLVVLDPQTNEARKITNDKFRIYDFAVSPDGARIVYSLDREDKDAERDLWLINNDGTGRELLVRCDGQVCQAPSWSGDGTRIAFERRNLIQGAIGRTPGPGRIWVVDTRTKDATPLFADEQRIGSLPRFAPSGDRLAYYDTLKSAVTVIDIVTNDQVQLPSVLGDSGAWSPDATQLVYSELQASDLGQNQQLLRADLARNVITGVMALTSTNDTFAVWSPIGDVLAFGRQIVGDGAGGGLLGPQLWLVAPDGRNPRALTNDPEFSHGAFDWSPDGQWLVFQRYNLLQQDSKPEIWMIKANGSERRKLADDASQPAWLP